MRNTSRTSRLAQTPATLQGVVLLLPSTLAVMGIAVLVPDVPQLMAAFHRIPHHQYLIQGGVLTLPALCVAVLSPFAGWLADRIGRRRLLLGSMVAYAVAGVAPTMLHRLSAVIVSRAAVGICEAAVITVSTTLIGDYFEGRAREKWLANQTAVASLSTLVLIPLAGLLGRAYGWRGPFAIYSVSLMLAVLLWLFTWEPVEAPSSMDVATHVPGDRADGTVTSPWIKLAGICAITLLASVMFYTVATQGALALAALGVRDAARIGVLTMVATLGVPAGTLAFRAAARLPLGALLCLEFLIIGGGFLWMGEAGTPGAFVTAAAVNQIGCGMILPTLLTWAARGFAFSVRGRGIGFWQSTFAVGQFLSGLVLTGLAGVVGGLPGTFVALGTVAVVAGAVAIAGPLGVRNRVRASGTSGL